MGSLSNKKPEGKHDRNAKTTSKYIRDNSNPITMVGVTEGKNDRLVRLQIHLSTIQQRL